MGNTVDRPCGLQSRRAGSGLKRGLCLGLCLGLSAISPSLWADEIRFTPGQVLDWPSRSFEGHSDYRLVDWGGEPVLQARAQGQASAKYLEREVDLEATPYLHWCWRVSTTYAGLDETTKAGDDYPARVYVARKTGLLPFQVQSVNYVWSSNQAAGADWPNAFTERAHLLALQGVEATPGTWVAEVRDVGDDFASLFGERATRIKGVALMSDGDNAGGDARAWFARLGFSDSPEPPTCPSR